MSLEQLINELARIHAMHPNASAKVTIGRQDKSLQDFEIVKIRYDILSKTAVIEL